MISIRFNLTPEDYAELERERRGGVGKRIVRIRFGVFGGFVGVFTIWQIVAFPWKNHPFGNLLLAAMGLFCLWGALETPGLAALLLRFSDPYGAREIQICEDNLIYSSRGKSRQFPWKPGRGFKESERFFFFHALRDEMRWIVPRRSVTHEQELDLRELLRRASSA